MHEDQQPAADIMTAPLRVPVDQDDGTPEAVMIEERAAKVRALGQDVERLAALVGQLTETAAALGGRLDGEVREAIDGAEKALAEARGARQETADADERTRKAEARADLAIQEAADAREELDKGLAAAKVSIAAAQESEANAWKEAGASQQARATSTNEAAHAEGLRKRAEAAWSSEHQARTDAEKERDDLAARLAAEQTALAAARSDLAGTRSELAEARSGLEAAAETERRLRAELSVVQGEIAGLTIERDTAKTRAVEQAGRADRAEQLADTADARIEIERARADRAEARADDAEIRITRDAATVRALQDTIRSALDLPAVEELGDGRGIAVGESGAVTAKPGGLIALGGVPELMDGELAARFARALLAVRVHQATRRPRQEDDEQPGDAD
ncbi:hypothetical protein [Spirillospora sp. NPDC048823]|uniref:hypothetical protein n=1 Tax=unclassified Spirillospora TaxID=2642701 RepID=UPI00372064F5